MYILSTGRVGTNFLNTLFQNKYDNLHQTSDSRFFNIIGNMALFNQSSRNFLLNKLEKTKINNMLPFTLDPLKSVSYYLYFNNNRNLDISVVHLIRDPRDFVSSFMNWKNRNIKGIIYHHVTPLWQPHPRHFTKDNFATSKFEHFCWLWTFKNRLFRSLSRNFRYKCFKLENFSNDDELNNLQNFLKIYIETIPSSSSKLNTTPHKKFPKWKFWNPSMAKSLEKYCGPLMRLYGYGDEKEWKRLLL